MSRRRVTSVQGPNNNTGAGSGVVDDVADAILEGGGRLQQLEQLHQPAPAKRESKDAVVGAGVGAQVHNLDQIPQERMAAQMGALQLLQLKEPIAGGGTGRIFLERAMADLANDGFSPAAQRRFIDDMRTRLKLTQTERDGAHLSTTQKRDLAWVASKLRQAVDFSRERPETRLDEVAEFFDEQGQRLRWFDKYNPDVHHGSLNRMEFRAEVRSIIEDAKKNHGGVLTEHHIGAVLSRLAKVSDIEDMQWARHQINRHIALEEVTIPERYVVHGRNGRPDKVVNLREKFDAFMAKKLVSNVDVQDVALHAYMLRQALKAAHDPDAPADTHEQRLETLKHVRDTFSTAIAAAAADKDNPDALFAARRSVCRELGEHKCGLPEADALRSELLSQIDAKLAVGDRLDRYARKREIETLRKGGVITDSEASVMRLAVASSVTETEFRATTTYFDQALKLQVFTLIAKVMSEVSETIRRNMSDDEYDSAGNIVVSGAEKRRRELERLLLQQQYERLVFDETQRNQLQADRVFAEAGIKVDAQHRIELKDSIADRMFAKAGVHTPTSERIQVRNTIEVKQERRAVTKSAQVREHGARTAQTGLRSMLPAAAKTTKPADAARYGSLLGLIAQFEAEAVRNSRQQLPV